MQNEGNDLPSYKQYLESTIKHVTTRFLYSVILPISSVALAIFTFGFNYFWSLVQRDHLNTVQQEYEKRAEPLLRELTILQDRQKRILEQLSDQQELEARRISENKIQVSSQMDRIKEVADLAQKTIESVKITGELAKSVAATRDIVRGTGQYLAESNFFRDSVVDASIDEVQKSVLNDFRIERETSAKIMADVPYFEISSYCTAGLPFSGGCRIVNESRSQWVLTAAQVQGDRWSCRWDRIGGGTLAAGTAPAVTGYARAVCGPRSP